MSVPSPQRILAWYVGFGGAVGSAKVATVPENSTPSTGKILIPSGLNAVRPKPAWAVKPTSTTATTVIPTHERIAGDPSGSASIFQPATSRRNHRLSAKPTPLLEPSAAAGSRPSRASSAPRRRAGGLRRRAIV